MNDADTTPTGRKKAHRLYRSCDRACRFFGWDPDGGYCVHPNLKEEHPFGLTLERDDVAPCNRADMCGPSLEWFESKRADGVYK